MRLLNPDIPNVTLVRLFPVVFGRFRSLGIIIHVTPTTAQMCRKKSLVQEIRYLITANDIQHKPHLP